MCVRVPSMRICVLLRTLLMSVVYPALGYDGQNSYFICV